MHLLESILSNVIKHFPIIECAWLHVNIIPQIINLFGLNQTKTIWPTLWGYMSFIPKKCCIHNTPPKTIKTNDTIALP